MGKVDQARLEVSCYISYNAKCSTGSINSGAPRYGRGAVMREDEFQIQSALVPFGKELLVWKRFYSNGFLI